MHAVRPGDDPYWLKRLPNKYIFHLPGRGRRLWLVSEPFPTDVGVAIVCHNNREPLAHALASLDAAGCPCAAILVVDVASTDGTPSGCDVSIRAFASSGWIATMAEPGRNIGIRA